VEWNDAIKTKSWVNNFAFSISNPKPIISFERNNNLLDKMPFCHLTQYCSSNTAVDIVWIFKVSTCPAGIKYKFGIQVPKVFKNTIDLDKKNGNQLWQEAIKTEIKQLTDYYTIRDSYYFIQGRIFQQVIRKILTIWFLMSNMA
jgi:hypothetical protein